MNQHTFGQLVGSDGFIELKIHLLDGFLPIAGMPLLRYLSQDVGGFPGRVGWDRLFLQLTFKGSLQFGDGTVHLPRNHAEADDDDHDEHCCCGHHHDHDDDDEDEHEHHHHDHDDHDEHCCCGHHHHHHDHDADEVFTSWGVETAKKFSKADIEHALTELDTGNYGMILRSKGIVDGGADGWLEFDYVPGEWEVRARGADVGGKLVVIGSKLDEKAIAALFGC